MMAFDYVVGVRIRSQERSETEVTCSLVQNVPKVTKAGPISVLAGEHEAKIESYVDEPLLIGSQPTNYSYLQCLGRDAPGGKVNFVRCHFDVVIHEDHFFVTYFHGPTKDTLNSSESLRVVIRHNSHVPPSIIFYLLIMFAILVLVLIIAGTSMYVVRETVAKKRKMSMSTEITETTTTATSATTTTATATRNVTAHTSVFSESLKPVNAFKSRSGLKPATRKSMKSGPVKSSVKSIVKPKPRPGKQVSSPKNN